MTEQERKIKAEVLWAKANEAFKEAARLADRVAQLRGEGRRLREYACKVFPAIEKAELWKET